MSLYKKSTVQRYNYPVKWPQQHKLSQAGHHSPRAWYNLLIWKLHCGFMCCDHPNAQQWPSFLAVWDLPSRDFTEIRITLLRIDGKLVITVYSAHSNLRICSLFTWGWWCYCSCTISISLSMKFRCKPCRQYPFQKLQHVSLIFLVWV